MEKLVKSNIQFWNGKNVFITGNTGFKGSWLSQLLIMEGANVRGYSDTPPYTPILSNILKHQNIFETVRADIKDFNKLKRSVVEFQPDIIFHLAAQPLVRESYQNPVETYSTNVLGTLYLLESARELEKPVSIVNITTDKCYENKEWIWNYRENEPLGGYDPYSSSKACSELISSAYRKSFFKNSNIKLATVRAGNVIGGGDWSTDRLIPDSVRSFSINKSVLIRNPIAIRPWQHVLEPVFGYKDLAEKLHTKSGYDEAFNFGPLDQDCRSVQWIMDYLVERWGDNAKWVIDKSAHPHEAQLLKLDISKVRKYLNWKPTLGLEEALDYTVEWYKAYNAGAEMIDFTIEQIKTFRKNAK